MASRIDGELDVTFSSIDLDAHSAVGIWSLFFLLMWGISGFYFAFQEIVNAIFRFFDPADKVMDQALDWLSMAHFGRFGRFTRLDHSRLCECSRTIVQTRFRSTFEDNGSGCQAW